MLSKCFGFQFTPASSNIAMEGSLQISGTNPTDSISDFYSCIYGYWSAFIFVNKKNKNRHAENKNITPNSKTHTVCTYLHNTCLSVKRKMEKQKSLLARSVLGCIKFSLFNLLETVVIGLPTLLCKSLAILTGICKYS